eukprot:TRINITY_DN60282_c0_g1_i1.p1 TRINITY_DN60282_c0_g1~~TRINITY_DN60282_c0_g1_i1.p1  ORF type:complete len:312 (+),score=9.31 TRINITY_DN60282_c0_g1_i1:54-989(+)
MKKKRQRDSNGISLGSTGAITKAHESQYRDYLNYTVGQVARVLHPIVGNDKNYYTDSESRPHGDLDDIDVLLVCDLPTDCTLRYILPIGSRIVNHNIFPTSEIGVANVVVEMAIGESTIKSKDWPKKNATYLTGLKREGIQPHEVLPIVMFNGADPTDESNLLRYIIQSSQASTSPVLFNHRTLFCYVPPGTVHVHMHLAFKDLDYVQLTGDEGLPSPKLQKRRHTTSESEYYPAKKRRVNVSPEEPHYQYAVTADDDRQDQFVEYARTPLPRRRQWLEEPPTVSTVRYHHPHQQITEERRPHESFQVRLP